MPVSAVSGDQVELLADLLVGLLPEGPQLYPDGDLTDAPEEILAAELIREAALEGVRDELPHSIAVVVEEMGLREGRPDDKPLLDIHANLYVERSSQKGIVIGHQGARLREVGTARPPADRGTARHAGLPRPPRQDRQGLAARPQAAAQAGLLTSLVENGRVLVRDSAALRASPTSTSLALALARRRSGQPGPSRRRSAGRPATAAAVGHS